MYLSRDTEEDSFISNFVTFVRADKWLYLALSSYSLAGSLFLVKHGLFHWASFDIYPRKWFFMFAVFMPAVAIACDTIYVIHRFDNRRRLVFRRVFSPKRLAYLLAGVSCLMALSLFKSVFTALKTAFPIIQGGFPYDSTHAALDRMIHFDTDPWRFLQPGLGFDTVRLCLEWNYNVMWFVICFTMLFFVMTSPKAAAVRTRYFLCFCLVWVVVGTLVAGSFLSAGPAFYGFVTGDTGRFADQLAFLARSDGFANSSAGYQHYLWTVYTRGSVGFGTGISAFPSVHVALITMTALFIRELQRKLAIPLMIYVGIVMVSSVYLGWHYAIDGYVSLAVTLLMYLGVNKASSAIEAHRQRRYFPKIADGPVAVPA